MNGITSASENTTSPAHSPDAEEEQEAASDTLQPVSLHCSRISGIVYPSSWICSVL